MKNKTDITAGTKVFAICGPGEFAADGMCARTGVILGTISDKFGNWFEVMFDDGSVEHCRNIDRHDKPGVGLKLADPNF